MYGLTLRFFLTDKSCVIKFDEVDAQWQYSSLEGPYGPVDKLDLFVGSNLRVFGRHLSITATSGSTCHWIEHEGNRLKKRVEFLQSKVESVGSIPVVRRETPMPIHNITRLACPGSTNLRRLDISISKLSKQLADLGLAHLVNSAQK